MHVREIMSNPVLTVTSRAGVKEAAALLVEHGFTALPVVDDGRLVGIISEADLMPLESTPDPRSHILPLPVDHSPAAGTVAEVMTSKVITLPPDADVAQAAQLLLAHNLRSIPVATHGRVVGIVTRRDLLRVLARGDEQIRRDLAALLAEELPDEPISLEVADGAVTLTFTGSPDSRDRRIAELLASTVPGVLSVRST
jgi:CBS domain-containing protein